MIDLADRFDQFGGRQVRGSGQIAVGDGWDGFPALGGIDFGAGRGDRLRIRDGRLGGDAGGLQFAGLRLAWRPAMSELPR